MERRMEDSILEMVRLFSMQGHTEASADLAIGKLHDLLRFKPLHPLTGNQDEWHATLLGERQNRRLPAVYMDENGVAYNSRGIVFRDPDGACFNSRLSAVIIDFPYTPEETVYVDVPHRATEKQEKDAIAAAGIDLKKVYRVDMDLYS